MCLYDYNFIKFWSNSGSINYMNLCKTKGIFCFENYDLTTWFNHFKTFLIILARFGTNFLILSWSEKGQEPGRAELKIAQGQSFDFELKWKRSVAEQSRAENHSARAMAWARLSYGSSQLGSDSSLLSIRGATGVARPPKLDKTPIKAAHCCCPRLLFFKIKVRLRSCQSYPIWCPLVCM